jgi:hypothetical protein
MLRWGASRLPRFIFTVSEGYQAPVGTNLPDRHAQDFADMREARQEAVRLCGEILRDHGDEFVGLRHLTVTLADENGLTLCVVDCDLSESPAAQAFPARS